MILDQNISCQKDKIPRIALGKIGAQYRRKLFFDGKKCPLFFQF